MRRAHAVPDARMGGHLSDRGARSSGERIAKGYCNPFLLKLATPAENDLVRSLQAKLAARVKPLGTTPRALQPGSQPAPTRTAATTAAPPGRASARYDAGGIGSGLIRVPNTAAATA